MRITREGQGLNISTGAVTALVRIQRAWLLSSDEMAALIGATTDAYQDWCRQPDQAVLTAPQLVRASHLMTLHRRLRSMFRNSGDRWFTTPNPATPLVGATPLRYALDRGVDGLRDLEALLHSRDRTPEPSR